MDKKNNEKPDETALEELVDEFLKKQEVKFSQFWRGDLIVRLVHQENTKHSPDVEGAHNEKLSEMMKNCRRILKYKYPQNNQDDIDESVNDAYIKWQKSFDSSKSNDSQNPEGNYLNFLAERELNNRHRNSKSTVELEDFKSEDDMQGKLEIDENKATVEIGKTRYAAIASREIYRFYLLTERFKPTSRRRAKPELKTTFEHDKKALVDTYKKHIPEPSQFELLKDSDSTAYNIKRWQILRSADNRQWMELAVAELRKSARKKQDHLLELGSGERNGWLESAVSELKESKEEMIRYLSKLKNGAQIIKLVKTPVLSSVALDENGNLITTCFKGQIEENTILGTWAKHCEFSLFTEVIGERNLGQLANGTLYTTLEPCNKRGTYMDDDVEKPKIPCAVRCLESGIKNICIGLDYNKRVFEKGLEILKTGEYTFELEKGKHKGNPEERKAAGLLENYLEEKYPSVPSDGSVRKYKICEGLNISFFHPDLLKEIKELNAIFLMLHQEEHENKFFISG